MCLVLVNEMLIEVQQAEALNLFVWLNWLFVYLLLLWVQYVVASLLLWRREWVTCKTKPPSHHACMCTESLSRVWLFATLWIIACQAPLSMGFSRQEYWSGFLCPPPGHLPHPGIEPVSPIALALQVDSLPLSHQGRPLSHGTTGEIMLCILCALKRGIESFDRATYRLNLLFFNSTFFFFLASLVFGLSP